ncbi:MAG: cbb3-type cytochrome c oxidase subunit I [Bacteroidia bacterium]|nr:cbb3-type cytochrome c oxidase subunit I [Bacteroidia bacterium]
MSSENHDSHDQHHEESFIWKYVFSMDHKMIGKQFLLTGMFWAVMGMLLSLGFRLQLGWPGKSFPILETFFGEWAKGGVLDPEYYLSMVTIHGTVLVFFVLTAGLSGTFSNILIPLQCGVRDMASPFLNMLSYWFFFMASCVMLSSFFMQTMPASGGWTVYPPLSALPQAVEGSGIGMTLWLISMSLFIISALLGGLNYIATILNLRTKGLTMMRLPLTIWTFLITAILGVLSFPVLLAGCLLLIFDRGFGTSFFLSDIFVAGEALDVSGGSPVLFQHLFWFLGHPEVYIIILPAMGLVSEVLSTNARKPIFGYKAMVYSLLTIAFLSFIVWGHHMFMSGMNPFLGSVFLVTTLAIAIPSAVKVFNWITTLYQGNNNYTPAMLFAVGFVSTFVTGGITGLFLGNPAIDIILHDTYFVVAHFHIVMAASAFFGMFAGVYHWFPKLYGKFMNRSLGYLHFWFTIVGIYMVFFPMHYMRAVPRRYYSFGTYEMFDLYGDLNVIISIGAFIAAAGQSVFLFNFFYSVFRGKKATQNPWNSNTIEWTTPVKHLHGNWPGEIPHVHRWAYDYGKPGAPEDFISQTVPLSETPESNTEEDKKEIAKEMEKVEAG